MTNYASRELGLTPSTKKLLQNRTVPMWEIPESKVVRLKTRKSYCRTDVEGTVKEAG